VRGAGQGGGGALEDRELEEAVFSGRRPLLAKGNAVHTDNAQAYISLGAATCSLEAPPEGVQQAIASAGGEWRGSQPDKVQAVWRMETQEEADKRAMAELWADPLARRKQQWAAKYAHLKLAHNMVVHKRRRGQRVQYTAVCRVELAPEVAAQISARGGDPLLVGTQPWWVGGTQKVDGYWRLLRQRVGQSGCNTARDDALHQAARTHQRSYWAGPDTCLLTHLGAIVQAARARKEEDVRAALSAQGQPILRRLRRVWGGGEEESVMRGRRLLEAQGAAEEAAERRRRHAQASGAHTAASMASPKAAAKAKGRPQRPHTPLRPPSP